MRSPHGGVGGFIAMTIMGKFNPPSVREAIRRLDLQPNETFLELGAGHGAGLREIAELKHGPPKRIVCVEISESFRNELHKTITELPPETSSNIEIHGEDCRSMPYLDDASVDKIFGMNVVYFLDPLSEYLAEINRVLKPKGKVVFGCKFANLPRDNAEFVNVSKSAVVDAMGEAGFEVSTTRVAVDGGDPAKDYIEVLGEKRAMG
jgi:cyclopropane fatty-acyl-phospholipid synthase-like methyltransferase